MKKLLMFIMVLGIIVGLSGAASAYPNSIAVDSYLNGCEEYNLCDLGYSILSVFFPAGEYIFTVNSGAFLSGSVPYGDGVFPMQYFWGLNIYQPSTSTEYVLGNYAPYSTAGNALSANLGQSIQINHSTDGDLLFYVRDDKPRDNSGSLTVNVVPEPVSSSLFLIGGAVFAGRRFLKKKTKI